MNQIEFFEQQKFSYVQLSDENEKKNKRNEIIQFFKKVNTYNKDRIREVIYPVLRDEISYAYTLPNYSKVLTSFDEIRYTDRYKNESIDNNVILKNMLIKAYLFMYLDSDEQSEEYFTKASELLRYIESVDLEQELSGQQYELEREKLIVNKSIYQAIIHKNLWTEFTFAAPFPIGISNAGKEFIVNGTRTFIKTEKYQSGEAIVTPDRGFVEINYDKYGLLTRTKITLKVNKYFSSENRKRIYHVGEKETRTEAQINSLKIINSIVSRYRLLSKKYWIDNVDIRMLNLNSVKIYADDIEIKNILMQSENSFMISTEYEYNTDAENRTLQKLLQHNENEILWQELLADSKSYLLVNKLRESIISLNSSFENYFYSRMKSIICRYEDEDKVENFFKGEVTYTNFEKLMDYDTFSELSTRGLLKNGVPSVFQIVKQYYLIVPEGDRVNYTKRQMNSSINKIRLHRNDIVHGNQAVELFAKHVYEAINEFEKLTNQIEECHVNN